jgi:predicted nucleic acid-binding protein
VTALVDTSVLIDHLRGHELAAPTWYPVDADVAEKAGAIGRTWLPSHREINSAGRAIAATAIRTGSRLLTRNARHFSMFPGLRSPY